MGNRAESEPSPALKRAYEMMEQPIGQLPWLAVEYMRQVSREVGFCGEVGLTAYCAYAQCVEGLECTEDLYQVEEQDRRWFEQKKLNDERIPTSCAGGREIAEEYMKEKGRR